MILKGSQRGGARQLATHLLRTDENDHVELHEVRGFVAGSLQGALSEAYAISKGTRCQQFLFSLSLSPPQTERVPVDVFEAAIEVVEAKLGLNCQPRAIVFHEKQGRRHAHCIWSRVDPDAMRAINLPHFKLKLRDVSRQLYIEHGWRMPRGLVNSAEADPRNFTRAEWQQAKRAGRDARELKEAFQDAWGISDSRKAFAQALSARGLYLAQGDRRSFVAVDVKGELYAVAKWTGLRTKAVRDRLGDPTDLLTVAATKTQIAALLKGTLGRHLAEAEAEFEALSAPVAAWKAQIVQRHRQERADLHTRQSARFEAEARQRAARFRIGILGIWDRLTGRYAKTCRESEAAAEVALNRDRRERQALINEQLRGRRQLHRQFLELRTAYAAEVAMIWRDVAELDRAIEPARREPVGAMVQGAAAPCDDRVICALL